MIYSLMLILATTLAYVPEKGVVGPECTEENPCHGENHTWWSEGEDELYHERTDAGWPGKREDPIMQELQHGW